MTYWLVKNQPPNDVQDGCRPGNPSAASNRLNAGRGRAAFEYFLLHHDLERLNDIKLGEGWLSSGAILISQATLGSTRGGCAVHYVANLS